MNLDEMQESRTARNSFPQFEDEKPLFDNNQRPPGPSEPLFLSGLEVKVPSTINRYLRDYQRDGITFIYHNYAKSRGCILGDDMGLGKTVQVIGFLAAVLQKTGTWKDVENNRPEFLQSQKPATKTKSHKVFLIVAPLSVLYNWKDELDTWGHFRVVIVHSVRKDEELARIQRGRCEIALTTYETFRLCLDQFNSIDWAAIIVDEAHKIKNHRSQITQAMKEMKCKVRVGLTGTILQNNLEELWCVMDWAVPGCLGSLMGFKNQFSDPIEQGHKHTVTKRTLAEGRKAVANLAKRLSRYFLRRTKSFISDQLPKKDDRVVYCSLTDFQEAVYRAVLDTDDVVLMLQSSEKCPCGSGRLRKKCCYKLNADGVPLRNLYFSYLAILRKVANHVALLQSKEGTSKSQEKFVTAVCEKVFKKFPEFTDRCKQAAFEAMSDPMYSGKMKVLQRLLNHFVMKKSKVLLFSYSTKLLDVLESFCMAEGLEFLRLDGNTKSKERVKIVKDFNGSRDVHLCLVSTLAGGLGLNFTGANVVVLFDPTWNPANDLQAIDRAYRIGQCRDVTVFRLISLGTVEEIIYLRQIYKQQLQSSVLGRENARRYFEAVQGSDGEGGELFGIPNLFRLQTKGSCLTHQILEREGQVEVGIMTTRTQVLDQRTQEPVDVTPSEQAGPSAATGHKQTSVLDFSSGSEDEDPCCSLKRPPEPLREEELTSGKSGLYDLLQKHMAQRVQQDPQDDSTPHEEEYPETRLKSHKSWDLSSESEEETDRFPLMEASDDAPSSSSHHKTRRKSHVHKQVQGTDSETEGSSDDEEPLEKVKTIRFSHLHQNKLQTCGSNKTQFADGGNTASIDSLLGGLQQVSYTHSNQKVVGPSSTEDRLSRAAVRDVFKLNMHSQFPANQLLDLSETPGQTSEATHTDGGQAVEAHTRPHVEHPVKHTTKTTYRQKDDTVIVGETPSAVCRQQMEDMAGFFGAASVEDFAEEIVKGNSEHRLGRLQSFYDHKSPDLTHLCKKTFVNPDTGPDAHVLPQPTVPSASRQRSTSKRTFPSPQQFQDEVTTPKDGDKRKLKKKKLAFDSSGLHIQAKLLDKTSSSSNGNISNVPSISYAPVDESEVDLRRSPEPFNDQEDPSQTPRASIEERPASDSAQNNITDLIGDTSILNDLFKTKRKTTGNLKEAAASACTERAKHRRKDFWDILNEGNEDNIDKLTDLTEVEKICTSARVSEKSKSVDLLETSQLWKKNENFLWKF